MAADVNLGGHDLWLYQRQLTSKATRNFLSSLNDQSGNSRAKPTFCVDTPTELVNIACAHSRS
ncbi:hypothetical protein BZZ01_30915 [Nostocales cyanobacterium HT-58-2]|nr:hypothetical protein BZZ01_30915 [Nostocales cyanobacterium HT-58-2]